MNNVFYGTRELDGVEFTEYTDLYYNIESLKKEYLAKCEIYELTKGASAEMHRDALINRNMAGMMVAQAIMNANSANEVKFLGFYNVKAIGFTSKRVAEELFQSVIADYDNYIDTL